MTAPPAPHDSAAYLRLVLASASEAFYSIDCDGTTRLCNAAFLRMTGFADENAVIGRKLHDVIHHTHPDGSRYPVDDCPIYRCAQTGQPAHVATENFYRIDGTPFPIEYWAHPIIDDGQLKGAICSFVDITERRQTEAALRESESRFRAAVAAVQGVMWTNSADGEMLGDQPGWAALTGQTVVEYEGYGWADAVHPDDAEPTIDAWKEAVARRQPFLFEHWVRRSDGIYRLFAIRAIPVFGHGGDIVEWVGVHTDITDERDAALALVESERRLRESEIEFRGVAEAMPGFIWTADAQGAIEYTSPTWHEYSRSRPEESIGSGWASFVHPDDQPNAFARWADSLNSGEPYEVEFRLRAGDGSYHWWLARAHRQQGAVTRWIGTASELDAIVAARETLAHSRDHLEREVAARTADLRATEEQLRQSQKLEAIGQLTGGVAHDFNNLLTVIRGSIDLMRRPGLADDRRERYLGAIADTVTRATKLTSQLLAFARRQALQPQVFDVGTGIAALRDMIATLTGSRIRVEIDFPPDPCLVDADPSQFDTALVNMVVNARDAMDGEGALSISVACTTGIPAVRTQPAQKGEFVAVSITDTGSGIDADRIDQIFEPFYTTKRIGQGTGLGLSQVYGFAKQSGGEVRATSDVGVGTVFTLYLPRASGAVSLPAQRTDVPLVAAGGGACVLVVEDNVDVGTFAKQALAELGYDTVFAEDARAALAELAIDADRFDVVFSDVMMPGMTGLELGGEIRRRHPGLPAVLTSGYSQVLAEHGSAGFPLLHKPYAMDELSRVLQTAAAQRQRNKIPIAPET